ncbi:cadherin-22 [Paroedura picta]|uniref:cadherin-22 n=1 Tax=Paroedura picta TaxID=143630 RepID=UPI00405610AA
MLCNFPVGPKDTCVTRPLRDMDPLPPLGPDRTGWQGGVCEQPACFLLCGKQAPPLPGSSWAGGRPPSALPDVWREAGPRGPLGQPGGRALAGVFRAGMLEDAVLAACKRLTPPPPSACCLALPPSPKDAHVVSASGAGASVRASEGFSWMLLMLLLLLWALGQPAVLAMRTEPPGDGGLPGTGRVKRGWVWNQFFVVEEYTGTEPLYVGKIHSDSDEGDGSIKYTISGEGAGTIFLIDELTGDIHATERLDREHKTSYTLRAQARDRQTGQLLEPESEFVIKVQDVNDSEPRFLGGPYIGSVAELSPVGTSVMQVLASDADDPTYGSSARVVYSVLEGEQHFTVDSKTGVIRTAVANLDRETQDRYEVVIRATDMAGQLGGLSGSTTVTIVITDVNDNPPRFPQKMYQFSIVETAPVGTLVGRVKAEDSDVGENTDMTYQAKDAEGRGAFQVATDSLSQEALLSVQKPLDFEAQPVHTVVVEALNKFADPRFTDLGTFRDQAIVRVTVLNVDEPPEFQPPQGPMEVPEDAPVGSVVGVVSALDPDAPDSPIRYAIDRSSDLEHIFDIDPEWGTIVTGKLLDRETAGWHNITVLATEADNLGKESRMSLRIRILDVNDNPPELATPYEAAVCEDAKPGELIHTISVVDPDEPQSGHQFYFTLAPESSGSRHFSLLDFTDNTAAVRTQRPGFNRQEQDLFLLPILVVDSGPPALSSTGTLTIHVCGCDGSGAVQSCNATAYDPSASLSPGALIALLVCVLILVVLVLLILALKRHQKGPLASEEDEDMRDNVIKYNDEGGGEQDTQAYDMSALRNLYDFSEAGGEGPPGPPSELRPLPQWGQAPDVDFSLFREYISRKVGLADEDPAVPPYDAFQTYAFEGADSPLTSFSSITSRSTGGAGLLLSQQLGPPLPAAGHAVRRAPGRGGGGSGGRVLIPGQPSPHAVPKGLWLQRRGHLSGLLTGLTRGIPGAGRRGGASPGGRAGGTPRGEIPSMAISTLEPHQAPWRERERETGALENQIIF